jgi:serine/threonine protein phosphatase 1
MLLRRKTILSQSSGALQAATVGAVRTREDLRIYGIGDIHGMSNLARLIFELIDAENADWKGKVIVVGLGDYIDRGPQSNQVIECLLNQSRIHGEKLVLLCGNHEDLLLKFLDKPKVFGPRWLQLGGEGTLVSYGVKMRRSTPDFISLREEFVQNLPLEHLTLLRGLRSSFEIGDLFFSHAGARPGVALFNQVETDLLWTRWRPGEPDVLFEKVIVHGHTAVNEPRARGSRINVDTGAYYTGRLSAVRITSNGFSFLTATAMPSNCSAVS